MGLATSKFNDIEIDHGENIYIMKAAYARNQDLIYCFADYLGFREAIGNVNDGD